MDAGHCLMTDRVAADYPDGIVHDNGGGDLEACHLRISQRRMDRHRSSDKATPICSASGGIETPF
jgi:hypothetical protein